VELPVDHMAETVSRCNPQRTIVRNGDGPYDAVWQPLLRGELHKVTIRETEKPTSPGPYPEFAALPSANTHTHELDKPSFDRRFLKRGR